MGTGVRLAFPGGDETPGRFAGAREAQCRWRATSRRGCNGERAAGSPCQGGGVLHRTSCAQR